MNGLVDQHIHLAATAAAGRSIDVSGAASVAELLAVVRAGSSRARAGDGDGAFGSERAGRWLRVFGYDDALLAERRHPTAAELDAAAGARPTVLHHVTGHVAVLSCAAMAALDVGADVAPDGLLVERQDVLASVPRPSREASVAAVAGVLARLTAEGFRACTDATHTNDADALAWLNEAAERVPQVSLTAMVGAEHLDTLNGLGFGDTLGGVRVGHAKVMPAAHDPSVTTSGQSVARQVAAAHERGFPVAIHSMDVDALEVALDALAASSFEPAERHGRDAHDVWASDRIEHCALALDSQLDRIAELGIGVVTQPSFVTRREAKYREQLTVVEQRWLWPLASLLDRHVTVGFGSDAPTAPANVEQWLTGATSRSLNEGERVSLRVARALASGDAALALKLHR